MKATVHIQLELSDGESLPDALTMLAVSKGQATIPAPVTVSVAETAEAPKKRTTRKKKAAKEEQAPAGDAVQFPTETVEAPAPDAKITRETVRDVAATAINASSTDAVVAVFGKYGAEKLTGLKEEDFAAVIADLKELM